MYLSAGLRYHGDLDRWYRYNQLTGTARHTASNHAHLLQPGGQQSQLTHWRILLFLVPVICLWPPRVISFQCQSHCLSHHSGHRTLMAQPETRTSSASAHPNLFSAVEPLPTPRIRLSLGAARCTAIAPPSNADPPMLQC
jgi:hypothetical protein